MILYIQIYIYKFGAVFGERMTAISILRRLFERETTGRRADRFRMVKIKLRRKKAHPLEYKTTVPTHALAHTHT